MRTTFRVDLTVHTVSPVGQDGPTI